MFRPTTRQVASYLGAYVTQALKERRRCVLVTTLCLDWFYDQSSNGLLSAPGLENSVDFAQAPLNFSLIGSFVAFQRILQLFTLW